MKCQIVVVLVAICLSACATTKPQVVKQVETVEVLTPSFKALDPRLTSAAPEPKAPPAQCREQGQPTVCNDEVLGYIDDLRQWGRGLYKQVTEIFGLQPKGATP